MPNHSTRRLRDLDLVEVPAPHMSDDWQEFTYSYQVWQCMWEDICPCNPILSGEIRRLYTVCVGSEDRARLLNTTLCEFYTNIIERRCFPFTGRGFYKAMNRVITEVMHCHCCTVPFEILNLVASLLTWFKRLPLFLPPPEKEWKDYSSYVSREIPPVADGTLASLRTIAHHWFSSFVWNSQDECRHGPGCTADAGRILGNKELLNVLPRWRAQLLRDTDGVPLVTGGDVVDIPSKFQSVPKQLGKNRYICMEPSALQYAQQGLFRSLYQYTRRTPLRGFFVLEDQDRNRSLCSNAYQLGLATIDLSNASDDVHYVTWKKVFQGLPLWRYVVGVRSRLLQYKDEIVAPNYIAPMGSALCFIFETICFCLIVELAYQRVRQQKCRGYTDNVSVYGDDIICPADVAGMVVTILADLGFTVNRSKTYLDGTYFESCGVEYVEGVRIERVSHPRHVLAPTYVTPAKVESILELASTLGRHGYFTARRFLLSSWLNKRVVGQVYGRDIVDWNLHSVDPDMSLPTHWHHDWQRSVRTKYVTVERYEPHDLDYICALATSTPRSRQERVSDSLGYQRSPVPVQEAVERLVRTRPFQGAGPHTTRLLKKSY